MNALANIYVSMHLQDLLDEAARERLRREARQARKSRTIASALTSLRQSLNRPRALPA